MNGIEWNACINFLAHHFQSRASRRIRDGRKLGENVLGVDFRGPPEEGEASV